MTKEEKHVMLCNSFKTQILALAKSIEQLEEKRDFIFCGVSYNTVIGDLDVAAYHLDEIIDSLLTGEDEDDEELMRMEIEEYV